MRHGLLLAVVYQMRLVRELLLRAAERANFKAELTRRLEVARSRLSLPQMLTIMARRMFTQRVSRLGAERVSQATRALLIGDSAKVSSIIGSSRSSGWSATAEPLLVPRSLDLALYRLTDAKEICPIRQSQLLSHSLHLLLTRGRRRPPLLCMLSHLTAHTILLTSSYARLRDLRLDTIHLLLLELLLLLATHLDSALPSVGSLLVAARSSRVNFSTEW